MKTLKLKSTPASQGHALLAHPGAAPGPIPHGGYIYEITEIPDEVPAHEVARLFTLTADVTWVGKGNPSAGRHVFRYAELGVGRIIRA